MKFLKEKRKSNKEKHGPRLPAVAKERLRRAGALVLALVLFIGAAFSDLPEGILSGLFSGTSAKADGTTKITMTNMYGTTQTDLLNRVMGRDEDTMWFFYANATNQEVFCLNSGYHLCSSDTYKYTDDTDAADYTNQDAAKAVYWYYNTIKGCGTYTTSSGVTLSEDVVRAAVQAYVWGGSTSGARYNAIMTVLVTYVGMTSSSAINPTMDIQNAIANTTNLTGTIYVYTCKSCPSNGYSTSSHQILLGWAPTEGDDYDYVQLSKPVSVPETVELTIEKIDGTSKNTIDEATFSLTMDGTTVTGDMVTVTHGSVSGSTFITEDGYITIEYTGSGSTKTVTTGEKWYVIRDKRLSGYYSSWAEAYKAASDELAELVANAEKSLASSSSTSHTWVATELTAPIGHELTSKTVTVKTSGSDKETMTFSDTRKYVANVTLKKICDPDFATIAANSNLSLAGAQYTIYAADTVYDPAYNDTAHVLYKKDQAITTITTNSSGVAKLSANSTLLPYGYNYYLKETKAPAGWEIDDSKYEFNTSDETITSEETPVFGYVEIYKNYEDYTGGSLALYPEINATFDIYKVENGTETRVETLTTETNGSRYGYAISGQLLYGTYVLRQTSAGDGADDTVFMPDYTFTISETEQVVSITYTNPDISVKIRVTKTKTTEDPAIDLYVSAAENDAVFYIVDESLLSGLTMDALNKMTASERKAAIEAKVSSDDIISVTTGYVYEPVSGTYTEGTDGVAETAVDAGATYWVIQVEGEAGYAVANVKSIEIPAGDTSYHDVSFDNKEYIVRVELTKYMAKYDASSKYSYKSGTEEPEEGALFYIIDQSSLSNTDNPQTLESLTQMNAAGRLNWADNYGMVLASFVTDSDGNGTTWFSKSDLSLQVGGAEGYALMDAITDTQWAANNTPYVYAKFYSYTDGDADQITVYTVDSSVIDPEEEAYLAVEKVYETSNNSFDPEEGAVFYVYNMSRDLVGVAVTDKNGYGDVYEPKTSGGSYVETTVTSEDGTKTTYILPGSTIAALPLADYTITQIYGSAGHKLADDVTVSLDSEYLYDTYVYGYDKATDSYYYENWSEDVLLDLTKLSSDTGAAVSGCTYEVVAMEDVYDTDGSILFDVGETVCTLGTDDNGQASWYIRYGRYSIQETGSTHNFVKDTTIYYFTVDVNGVTFTGSKSDDTSEDPKAPAGYTLNKAQAFTYTTEDGVVTMPDTWPFVSLTGTNGTVSGETIAFEITKANALKTFEAVFTDEYPTGEITVTKSVLAEDMEAYGQDAEFTFTLYDKDGKEVGSKTITITLAGCAGIEEGVYASISATFTGLEFGEYTLKETGMPEDFEFVEISSTSNGDIKAGVDEPDSVTFSLTKETYKQEFAAVYVDEYASGSITVVKYDSDGKTKLDGVTFTLYDSDGNEIATKTTGENGEETGQVLFDELRKGTYTLTETSTLDGLTLLADTISITIPLKMTNEKIAGFEADGITVDLTDVVKKSDGYWFYNLTYNVTDTATLALPMTGSSPAWYALVLVLAGFAVAGVSLTGMRRKKIGNRR